MKSITFGQPDIDEREMKAIEAVLRGGWLTTGKECMAFESELACAVKAKHAIATSSCTAALQLALTALDPAPGEIVITTPYNFVSTPEVVQHLGLTPMFVDIDPLTLNMDPIKLGETLDLLKRNRKKVAAVVPVHFAGTPCDLDAIDRLATKYDVAIVEDAAHALPSSYRSHPIGARRDSGHPAAVCFSFYANKTITTGEGGMLVTDDTNMAERCRKLSLHGINRDPWSRERRGTAFSTDAYDIEALGYKFNLTDLAAAMGRVQLRKLPVLTTRRSKVAECYDRAFKGIPEVQTPRVPSDCKTSNHLYVIRLHNRFFTPACPRDDLALALGKRGIATSLHYRPLHLHSHYRRTYSLEPESFPVSLAEYQRVLSLPIHTKMTDADVQWVIDAVTAWVDQHSQHPRHENNPERQSTSSQPAGPMDRPSRLC